MHLGNILEQAKANDNFRKVLATGDNVQVVLMSIPPEGEIGEETHPDNDQVLLLVDGGGSAILDGKEQPFEEGDLVVVPAGTLHNFTAGKDGLKVVTTYSPPHHPEGTVHATKAEADAAEAGDAE
ncbi:MAG TPA: cupin domain-containing protein [Patescibacteria group bacterium]|jgi:mannose-6-phosphate isomerase-like protein (cupin superfamily)